MRSAMHMARALVERPAIAAGFASWRSSLREIILVIREHGPLFAVVGLYVVLAEIADLAVPGRSILHLHVYDAVFALMVQVYVLVFLACFVVRELRCVPSGRSASGWLWERLRTTYLSVRRLTSFACAVVFGRVLTDTYTSLKAAIPVLHPYAWDETLAHWGQTLHGGHHAWELVQPIASPSFTLAVNFLYNAWMFVLFGVFMWQAWSTNEALRRRFFVTFGLSWMLLGSVAATVLSSAGPCYYARVTGAAIDPYAPLMRYLRDVDGEHRLWALGVQDALWQGYVRSQDAAGAPAMASVTRASLHDLDGSLRPPDEAATTAAEENASVEQMLEGISAMPSMHVAMAVLFALLAWNVNAWLGVAFTAFAISIQIGSVHLGWHYAVDGYVSIVAVTALWWAVGRWTHPRPD